MNELHKLLYIFQLEGYEPERFREWLRKNNGAEIVQSKQELKWTLKARLIYYLSVFIDYLTFHKIPDKVILGSYCLLSIPEQITKKAIIDYARVKMGMRKDLIVIGITGSYGKTSVKEILAHILSSKYTVLKTPESYNTSLGISKVIINYLKPNHQVFIVEMGAYKKGDIKTLCDIVHPRIGIITAVGKQHLERFGSQENIAETKFELIESLPSSGMAFLNIDDPIISGRSHSYSAKQVTYYGFLERQQNQSPSFHVNEINASDKGTTFLLKDSGGTSHQIQTQLLGKHDVVNTLAAISVAYYLGLPIPEIVKQCASLTPIPHRLQLMHGANGTTIIDDAFNANPDSARAALEVLRDFHAPRKIVITPGLIELGNIQYDENVLLGKEMSRVADYLIIVGETNRKALKEGYESRIMNHESRVFCVKNITEATEKLKEIVIPGAVILFENDLPDQYK